MIKVATVHAFFDGQHAMTVSRGGYDEPVPVPRASREAVDAAIREAIRTGDLWLTSGPASVLAEDVAAGLLTDDGELQAPPEAIPPLSLLPDAISQAWQNGRTTALSLMATLSQKAGRALPWTNVRTAIEAAFRMRLLERAEGAGPWPCDYGGAGNVAIQIPVETVGGVGGGATRTVPTTPADTRVSPELVLRANQIQDLSEVIPELLRVAAGHDLTFQISVALKGPQRPKNEVVKAVNDLLKQVGDGFELV